MRHHVIPNESPWAYTQLAEWSKPEDITVLLIEAYSDDTKDIIRAMVHGEPFYHFETVRKKSLMDGIKFLKMSKVDAVILDLEVPDARGNEAVGIIRRLFPELPIVAISSTSNIEIAHQAFKSGAQEFIYKETCDSIDLQQSVYQAIYRKRTHLLYERGDRL